MANNQRVIKFRAWDSQAKLYVSSGIQFNNTTMQLVSIAPITLEQFTGLLDSKGVKIYVGDIITDGTTMNNKPYPIEVKSVVRQMGQSGHGDYSTIFMIEFFSTHGDGKKVEIIGNVHQHKDLLYHG